MPEHLMYSWRFKFAATVVVLLVFVGLDRRVAGYATVIREGQLQRAICIGEVVDVNTGDILYLRDGTTLSGRITESDMYGNITLMDRVGEMRTLRKGLNPGDVLRTEEDQDQILSLRILTWPAELRKEGVDFRGTTVVVGNRFQTMFADRIMRTGDRLYIELPMTRVDRIGTVEVREYFRTRFLLWMGAVVCVALVLVGGAKGVFTIVATMASCLILLKVFVPGLLGRTSEAALNGAEIVGVLAALGGLAWVGRYVFEKDGIARLVSRLRARWFLVPRWLLFGGGGSLAVWGMLHVIGQRPVALALFMALAVTLVTFTVITGFSPKVISGSLGTLGGLVACGVISYAASRLLWFTGLDVELGYLQLGTALWRDPVAREWPFVDFLTAGLIIAALGAMMDVSMSVSSTIYEVKRANPGISVVGAMKAGYNVGKDIMSTMTDTLIFAFIGADLVLVVMPGLTFQEGGRLYPFMRLFNGEQTSVEAIHALMGTLGLVLAIPISALIAALLTVRMRIPEAHASSVDEQGGGV